MSTPSKSGFYIPSLDGIRALAFLIVFVSHAGLRNLIPGGFGVTIFFFLSGYLITTLLRKEFAQTGSIHLGQFYLRRVLRIFPPFYITMTILVLATLVGVLPGKLAVWSITAQAFFLSNYYAIASTTTPEWPDGTEVFWSLAVEEHFYLLFPFAAILLMRRLSGRAQAMALGFACLIFLVWRCVLIYYFHRDGSRTYLASDTRMDSILFGCILAVWSNPAIEPPIPFRPWSKLAVYGVGLGLLLFCLVYRDPQFRDTFRYTLQGIGLIPMFYFAVAEPDRPWFRWLNWPWVRFCGLLSYSLYLIHLSALRMMTHLLPAQSAVIQALLALALSAAYSVSLYYAVERPLARLRRRFHSDPRPPSAEPLPDAL